MKKKLEVVVVTKTTRYQYHGYDFAVNVFATHLEAEKWVEQQINSLIAEYELDRDTDVDGWYIDVDPNSSIQFDAKEHYVVGA